MLDYIEYRPASSQQAVETAIILCHGLSSSPENIRDFLPLIQLPSSQNIAYILPRAPVRALTLAHGQKLTAWFDLYEFSLNSVEDMVGLHSAFTELEQLVQSIQARGIDRKKIFVGGFSQGGALALHYLWRAQLAIGGIIALSAYLPLRHSKPLITLNKTPVFQSHGTADEVLPFNFGKVSCDVLQQHGFDVTWITSSAKHDLDSTVLKQLSIWLAQHLA